MCLSGERIVVEILFLVTLPAVAKSQPHAQGHDPEGRRHQDCDCPGNGLLPVFRRCRSGAVAHRAALCERRERRQAEKQKPSQQGGATPYRMRRCPCALQCRYHLTPSEIMRNASGKKTIIMARQNTSE